MPCATSPVSTRQPARRPCRREGSGSRGTRHSLRTRQRRGPPRLYLFGSFGVPYPFALFAKGWEIYNRFVPLLEACNLTKIFSSDTALIGGTTRITRAVDDVSL